MFLNKIKLQTKKIHFKITLWHLALLVISSCLLFIIFYFLFSQSLTNRNHEILEAKYQEYNSIYQREGVKSLESFLKSNVTVGASADFFVRLIDINQNVFFFHTTRQPIIFSNHEIESNLKYLTKDKEWTYIRSKSTEHDIEVLSVKFENGGYFQIGKTVVDRDVIIKRFTKNFLGVLFFAIILGGVGGIFLSNKMLLPLRNLIATLKSLQTGNEEARVQQLNTNDELEELTILFNQMLNRIQTSNQGMRQTLDTIAHELRTPLTSIRGLAEVTLRKKNSSESDYRKVLEDCIEGIDDLLVEFKTMTDITLVESGLQNLNMENLNFRAICAEVMDLYELIAEQRGIQITCNSENEIFLTADKKKIRQAMANLIDNAIKYSPQDTMIQIIITQEEETTLIKVKDQGIGISLNDLPLIWKRLYRGENSRYQKGIGLGLSLVKSIVEAHNGTISAENNKDSGSTFIISLPSLRSV